MSVLIGRELKLTDASLADLGVAALFHDVGYTNGEAGRTVSFGQHNSSGVQVLLRQKGFHEAKIRRIRVALEHHMDFDMEPKPSLYSRIVRIADDYDTLTRQRAEGAFMTPHDALARMRGAAGSAYDPLLLQLLINRLGKYPPGTMLELDDSSWVLVIGPARDKERFATPVCALTRLTDGSFPEEAIPVDLAEDPRQVRRVVGLAG